MVYICYLDFSRKSIAVIVQKFFKISNVIFCKKWTLIWNSLVYTTVRVLERRQGQKEEKWKGKWCVVWVLWGFPMVHSLKNSNLAQYLGHLKNPWNIFFSKILLNCSQVECGSIEHIGNSKYRLNIKPFSLEIHNSSNLGRNG